MTIMCTLAVFREVSRRYPLVVAANRDEFYARAAVPPSMLDEIAGVVAGRDLEAGGTWLGCRTEHPFLVAGILNRRSSAGAGAASRGQRSRGTLCLDALRSPSVDTAANALDSLDAGAYGGFNLLLADRYRAVVIDNRAEVRTTELKPGLSVLTNLDVNDPRCPRLASATRGFEKVADLLRADPEPHLLLAAVAAVLANHDNSSDPTNQDPLARVCVHTAAYGTRSASVIMLNVENCAPAYYHADGPPCRTPFEEVIF